MSNSDDCKMNGQLLEQYRQEVETIIKECEMLYHSVIDYEALDMKITKLILCAKTDGIHEKEIIDIIYFRLPAYVNYINYKKANRKKAA